MPFFLNGLHHVTALASDAQRNADFYVGILGLRLIKKTVNFDAPDVYHLYYGDETGSPGSILTFFPYAGLVKGRKGSGQLTSIALSVPAASLGHWMQRFAAFGIPFSGPHRRFDEEYLCLEDYDGTGLELVATAPDARPGYDNGKIPVAYAVRGIHAVSLNIEAVEPTSALLTDVIGYRVVGEENHVFRFEAGKGGPGTFIDLVHAPHVQRALQGAGSIHHVAFSTATDAHQHTIQAQLLAAGYRPTETIDRHYFRSIYFREPGGALFEIATDLPGFAIDEASDALGSALKLPPKYESRRAVIEAGLPDLVINAQ